MKYSSFTLKDVFHGRPTLGGLVELSQENYALLMQLTPELQQASSKQVSTIMAGVELCLEILEQTPYTSLVHLTHIFSSTDVDTEPDAIMRVYHDARQVEIQNLQGVSLIVGFSPYKNSLKRKWSQAQFLSRWLSFCLNSGHSFSAQARPAPVMV